MTPTLERPPPLPPRLERLLRGLGALERTAALLLAAVVFSLVQAGTVNIIGVDGQYHIKVAALMRELGPRLEFPWLRFTILNEARYTDHHFLFHLLQAPFSLLDLRAAAKMSSVVFATLGAWGCYLYLKRRGACWPLAWLALLLAIAHTFLWRHSMARPQSLSLLLLVAALWLVAERRLRWLAPLGFLAVWLFDGFPLMLAVPLAFAAARLLLKRTLDWRPTAWMLAGQALGLLLHPYFPNNVTFAVLHLMPKSDPVGLGEVRVGGEWYPYSSENFVTRLGPTLLVFLVGMVPLLVRLWQRRRPAVELLALGLLALGFFALQVRSQRIVEYFPAVAVLLAGVSWGRAYATLPPALLAPLARWRLLLGGLLALLLVAGLTFTVNQARRDTRSSNPNAQQASYRNAARWLAANTPYRSLVFNTDWDDFPQLFFWNHHNVYVVGLDPTYLSLYDPSLYRLWRSISSGGQERPSAPIRDRFGARYVITDVRHGSFLSRAAADPDLEEVFRSERAVVFRVH